MTVTSSDDGVIVRTPSTDLAFDEAKGHFVAEVDVEARSLWSQGRGLGQVRRCVCDHQCGRLSKGRGSGTLASSSSDEPSGQTGRGLFENADGVTTIKVMPRYLFREALPGARASVSGRSCLPADDR